MSFLLIAGSACSNYEPPKDGLLIPQRERDSSTAGFTLATYLERYEQEAAARGIDVNLEDLGITATLADFGGVAAGRCNYQPYTPNRIRLDSSTWFKVSDLTREYIIFHELGHCERMRGHLEHAGAGGNCLSIMASGTGECLRAYNERSRTKLLDELFDSTYYGTWP